MNRKYEVIARCVCPNVGYKVICYTEKGHIWGIYTGYYNEKKHLFTLIPRAQENRFSLGIGKLTKHCVSANLVKRVDP